MAGLLWAILGGVLIAEPADSNDVYLGSTWTGQDEDTSLAFTTGRSIADSLQNALDSIDEQAKEIEVLKSSLDSKVDPGHSKATMKVAGRVHADVWGFPKADAAIDELEGGPDGPQDRIGFRRIRFGVRGELPANMEYRIEMEFASGNNSEFRDVWMGWNDLPILQTLRIGNQKRPIGLDHWNSSRFNVFLERPFIIEGDNQDARRWGIQSWNSSNDLRWSWQYGVFNQRLIQDEGFYISDHWQLQATGRLANTFWYDETSCGRNYGHWAISGSWADTGGPLTDNGSTGPDASEARWRTRPEARTANRWLDTGVIQNANEFQELGLEGVLNFGPWQFVAEYATFFIDRSAGQADLTFHGGYVYAAYFLTGEHMAWDRRSSQLGRIMPFRNFLREGAYSTAGWGAWQVAVRGSYADYSDDDIFGGIGKAITVGINWYWTPYSRLQFNYIHGKIEDSWARGSGIAPGQPLLSGNYGIIGARFNVDF